MIVNYIPDRVAESTGEGADSGSEDLRVEKRVLFVLFYEPENRRRLLQCDLEVQTQVLLIYTCNVG